MSLCVANCTKQNLVFHYREPRHNLLRHVTIPSGTQYDLDEGWSAEETGKIVAQLERYGAKATASLNNDLSKFTGLLYSDVRVIQTDEIEAAHDAVLGMQQERSVTQATRAAKAFDLTARKPKGHPGAKVTEVEVIEQNDPREKPRKDAVEFSIAFDPERGRSDVKLPA